MIFRVIMPYGLGNCLLPVTELTLNVFPSVNIRPIKGEPNSMFVPIDPSSRTIKGGQRSAAKDRDVHINLIIK